MKDAPLFDLLIQASIKTEYQLVAFSDYSWQNCPDTGRITGEYIIFYQGGPIDHDTHFPGPVPQSGAESEYNTTCNAGLHLSHFRMLIKEWLNKYPAMVPKEYSRIILDRKASVCMDKNGKYIKHKRHISRRVHFEMNGEK